MRQAALERRIRELQRRVRHRTRGARRARRADRGARRGGRGGAGALARRRDAARPRRSPPRRAGTSSSPSAPQARCAPRSTSASRTGTAPATSSRSRLASEPGGTWRPGRHPGRLAPAGRAAPPARRDVPRVPGVLRAAARDGDERRRRHQRRPTASCSMLSLLVREQRPSGVAVAFDLPGATFRDEVVEDYKGGRDATPPELEPQIGIIIDLLGALAIPVVTKEGYEADDVLATLATRARDEGRDVDRRHGRPRLLPARGGPARPRPLQPPGRLGLLPLRRGGDLRAHRASSPRATRSSPRCAATPPTTCPACPGWGRRPPPSSSPSSRTSTRCSRASTRSPRSCARASRRNEELARRNAEVMVLVRDLELDVDPAELRLGGWERERGRAAFEAVELHSHVVDGSRRSSTRGSFGPSADGEAVAAAEPRPRARGLRAPPTTPARSSRGARAAVERRRRRGRRSRATRSRASSSRTRDAGRAAIVDGDDPRRRRRPARTSPRRAASSATT